LPIADVDCKFAPRLLTDYLAPMGAAIWSAPAARMLDFPAENFVAFFSNHCLLQYDRPVWRTVKGGSRRYVEKLTSAFRDQINIPDNFDAPLPENVMKLFEGKRPRAKKKP